MGSVEGGPRIPESNTVGGATPQAERGRQRVYWRWAFIGAAVGGVGAPLAGFVAGGVMPALFFQTPIAEIPDLLSSPVVSGLIKIEFAAGIVFGGVLGALRRRG